MSTNWASIAREVSSALKEEGIAMNIVVYAKSAAYNITTGISTLLPTIYATNGIIKNIETETKDVINPDTLEIIFHAENIESLSDKDKIEIKTDGKVYKIGSVVQVRPAGATLLYKAKVTAVENDI